MAGNVLINVGPSPLYRALGPENKHDCIDFLLHTKI